MPGFKEALKNLNDVAKDLTSLHVQTITGDIELKIEGGKFKSIEDLMKDSNLSAKLNLVADSVFRFDGDSTNFIASTAVSDMALTIHQNAVKSGFETRIALMNMFKDLFK